MKIFTAEDTYISYALPNNAASLDEFRKWILDAENMPSVSLSEAKIKWEQKMKTLKKLIK